VPIACFEYAFMGGSMGSVVGERFALAVEAACDLKVPFICFAASGGARMQEGVFSLMRMGKTAASVATLRRASIYLGIDTPDDGRRVGELCVPRRRRDR
jgi:acetyl-CoA carboxylase carboxyl transferase subunit beta